MREIRTSAREWMLLAAIMAAALFLRLFRIGHQSLWIDELLSLSAITPPPGVSFWERVLWDVHGPLYSTLLHFWSLVSMSDAWLRAPSAIAGTLSVFFIYRWIVPKGGSERATAAALILALNPFSLYYSQELRFYSLLVLFVIVSLIMFERFIEHPSPKSGAILGIVLALTCLSHFSGGFLCLALLVYLICSGRLGRGRRGPALLAAGIVLVAISPWVYREILNLRSIDVVNISTLPVEERLRGELTLNPWSYPYILYAFSTGYSFGPDLRELHTVVSAFDLLGAYWPHLLLTVVLFGGLTAAGSITAFREGRFGFFLSIAAVTIASGTIVALLNIKVFNIRYLMSAFPVFAALLAYGLPRRGRRRTALLGLVAAVMIVSDGNYHFVARYARDDYKGAARIINEGEEKDDLILTGMERLFMRYYEGPNSIAYIFPAKHDAAGLRRRVGALIEGRRRIWYLQTRPWYFDPADSLVTLLSSSSVNRWEWEVPGIRVMLFEMAVEPEAN